MATILLHHVNYTHAYTLYKLLVQVLLLEVHVYNSNTSCFGTLVGIYYTTTVCTTTI